MDTTILAELRKQEAYYKRRVAALKNPAHRWDEKGWFTPPEAHARLVVAQYILTYLRDEIWLYEAQNGKTGTETPGSH